MPQQPLTPEEPLRLEQQGLLSDDPDAIRKAAREQKQKEMQKLDNKLDALKNVYRGAVVSSAFGCVGSNTAACCYFSGNVSPCCCFATNVVEVGICLAAARLEKNIRGLNAEYDSLRSQNTTLSQRNGVNNNHDNLDGQLQSAPQQHFMSPSSPSATPVGRSMEQNSLYD